MKHLLIIAFVIFSFVGHSFAQNLFTDPNGMGCMQPKETKAENYVCLPSPETNNVSEGQSAGTVEICVSNGWTSMRGVLEIKVNGYLDYVDFNQSSSGAWYTLSNLDLYKDGTTISFRALHVEYTGIQSGTGSYPVTSTYPSSITLSGGKPYHFVVYVMGR